jgi:hypothetical protein
MSQVPSVLPSSTAMSSKSGMVWDSTLSRAAGNVCAALWQGMATLTRGVGVGEALVTLRP